MVKLFVLTTSGNYCVLPFYWLSESLFFNHPVTGQLYDVLQNADP